MPLEPLSTPWTGVVFRHIAAEARYSVLDFSRAGKATNNRWNVEGEPTLYLASDRGVGITEFSRHIDRDRPPAVVAGVLQRRLYRFEIRLDAVLDLLQPQTWTALSLADAPNCFLDRRIARATAHYIRATTTIQAIRVRPSLFSTISLAGCLSYFWINWRAIQASSSSPVIQTTPLQSVLDLSAGCQPDSSDLM